MASLLQFSVEGISCAITVGKTVFVERMVHIIPRKDSMQGLAGEINLHGRIVPVYQVRTLLGFPDRKPRLSDVLIITKAGSDCVALWVDGTSGTSMDYSPDQEEPPAGPEEPVAQDISVTAKGQVLIRDLAGFLKNPKPLRTGTAQPASKELFLEEPREDEERTLAILAVRAQKLSQPAARSRGVVRIEVLKFRLAYQEYAIAMKYIREVILTGGITPVPGTPEYISGICAIRGEIISLVDLRALFSTGGRGLTDLNRVIVVTDGTMTFGILADYITGIATIPASLPVLPAPSPDEPAVPYLLGIVEGIVVLDGGALLSDPRMLVDETAA